VGVTLLNDLKVEFWDFMEEGLPVRVWTSHPGLQPGCQDLGWIS
jgi:hypothetical protein